MNCACSLVVRCSHQTRRKGAGRREWATRTTRSEHRFCFLYMSRRRVACPVGRGGCGEAPRWWAAGA
eukprot:1191864-Prorocentrum_minimum.AAC.3